MRNFQSTGKSNLSRYRVRPNEATFVKGIVFIRFIDMAEERYGFQVMNSLLDKATIGSDGAYTAVGNYGHLELIQLPTLLSPHAGESVPNLRKAYGEIQFSTLMHKTGIGVDTPDNNILSFLKTIDNVIHRDVRKLYPDAALPRFSWRELGSNELELTYSSTRPLAHLA